jgi:hypothetical protein
MAFIDYYKVLQIDKKSRKEIKGLRETKKIFLTLTQR